jgi:hypothetical protein
MEPRVAHVRSALLERYFPNFPVLPILSRKGALGSRLHSTTWIIFTFFCLPSIHRPFGNSTIHCFGSHLDVAVRKNPGPSVGPFWDLTIM